MGNKSRVTNKAETEIVLHLERVGGRYIYGEIKLKKEETAKVDGRELRDKFHSTNEVSVWRVYRLENSKAGIYMGVQFLPYKLISGKTIHIKKAPDEDRWFAEEVPPTQNWVCPFFS